MVVCCVCDGAFVVFFKQKTAYEMRISDWSSDVCSSDLQHHDGRRRWVDLVISGITAQAGWQHAAGCIDGRLHVTRGAVDVPVQIEHQGDAGRPLGTDRKSVV